MNFPAIHSHIRVFSFRPAYFDSETKEEINTDVDDIYFRYPAIRSHIRVFSFVPRTLYSFDIPPYVPTVDCSIFVLLQLFQNHDKKY